MEGSSTSLTRWFQALFLLSQPAGISSRRLSQILEVTYKTAWHISHKIRHAMQTADRSEPLLGAVRMERIDYGSAYFPDAKQPLIIGATMDGNRTPKHVKIKQPHPEDVHKGGRRFIYPTGMESFVKQHLGKKSRKSYTRNGVRHPALNGIRRDLNVWLNETFQGIGAKHLQLYLDEFCFRLNLQRQPAPVFRKLLSWCAAAPALVYDELTKDRPVLPVPWLIFGNKAKWKGSHLSNWTRYGDC